MASDEHITVQGLMNVLELVLDKNVPVSFITFNKGKHHVGDILVESDEVTIYAATE